MSILPTMAIALVVWLLVWQQPAASTPLESKPLILQKVSEKISSANFDSRAIAREVAAVSTEQTATTVTKAAGSSRHDSPKSKPAAGKHLAKAGIDIVGITRHIKLADIDQLWQEFNDNKHLQRALLSSSFDVYAVYNNFNAGFSEADVAIGYHRDALNDAVSVTAQVPTATSVTLLQRGAHNSQQIMAAWQQIDFSRQVIAVIEHHQIDGDQDLVAVSVIYQD